MEKFPKAFLLGAATAAHQVARTVIREICPHAKVGLTLSLHDIQTVPGGEELAAQKWELEFRHYLPAIRDDDFLGVQNYTRSVIGPGGELPVPEGAETTQMDYEYYPQGLVHVLRYSYTLLLPKGCGNGHFGNLRHFPKWHCNPAKAKWYALLCLKGISPIMSHCSTISTRKVAAITSKLAHPVEIFA